MRYFNYTFKTLLFASALVCWQSCVVGTEFRELAPGAWRGVLTLEDEPHMQEDKRFYKRKVETAQPQRIKENELPFNFSVFGSDVPGAPIYLEIYNGSETIRVDNLKFWHTVGDSIRIEFPHYDSYIIGIHDHEGIEGNWVVKTKSDYIIPFRASRQDFRFTKQLVTPKFDVSGRWDVEFTEAKEEGMGESEKAVGEFKQDGNHLVGTFLTETGDYRFLEGTVQGDKMYLSCFDGTHAYLFKATLADDGTLQSGGFASGLNYRAVWSAVRNDKAALRNPDALTTAKSQTLNFSFPDADGKVVNLNDETFKNHVKIIQILGTWCPNCADETALMTQLYDKYHARGLDIIGVAFEKHEGAALQKAIEVFKKRFGVQYPILIGGKNKKEVTSAAFPALSDIMSFPTTIILDKNNQIVRVHTGFSGPATSLYADFVKELEAQLEGLLAK